MTTTRNRQEVTRQQIEMRAYEIYLQRGRSDGSDLQDWLTAERELLGGQERFESREGPNMPLHRRSAAAGDRPSS